MVSVLKFLEAFRSCSERLVVAISGLEHFATV